MMSAYSSGMDAERRAELATAAATHAPAVQRAVVASWPTLLPAAAAWDDVDHADARAACAAVLRGIITVWYQSDLDGESWDVIRAVVFGRREASRGEGAQLIQSVRLVGLELLAERLAATAGLTAEERWSLQQEAAWFCDTLLAGRGHVDADAYDELLAELAAAAADLG